jgi:hypothetical protein
MRAVGISTLSEACRDIEKLGALQNTLRTAADRQIRRTAAPLFRVSVSYIYKALMRRRMIGEVTPRPFGGGPKPKLAPHDDALRARVATKTWCPLSVSFRTVEGTMPTRYSLSLISFGTPTSIDILSVCQAEPTLRRCSSRPAHRAQTAHPSTGSVPTISMPKPEIPT